MKILRDLVQTHKSLQITLVALILSTGTGFAAGEKKMFSLDNTDFVVLLSFFLFVAILIYFKVPSIVASFLDKRSADIQNEIDKANEILEEAKKVLSSIEADHIKTSETIEQMINTAKDRAGEEEDRAKKQIEELIKSKLISAKEQVKSSERKIIEEIEERAIDLSIEKVRKKLSKGLSGSDYDKYLVASIQSIEKGLKQVYN